MPTLYIRNKDTFDQLVSGVKTIEIRSQSPFMESLEVGMEIGDGIEMVAEGGIGTSWGEAH